MLRHGLEPYPAGNPTRWTLAPRGRRQPPTYDETVARPRVLVLLAAVAAAVFGALLLAVAAHRGPLPLDGAVRDWFAAISTPRSRSLVRPVARLGAREVLVPLLLVGGTVLSVRRRTPGPFVLLAGTYLGMALVVGPVKTLLHRPEPLDLPGDLGRSFPSGHAAQAILVYGMLAALVAAEPVTARARAAASVLPIVASAAVGFAVLLRDAHWLSDMVAGYAIGLVWLTGPVALAHLRAPWLLGLPRAGAGAGRPAGGAQRGAGMRPPGSASIGEGPGLTSEPTLPRHQRHGRIADEVRRPARRRGGR